MRALTGQDLRFVKSRTSHNRIGPAGPRAALRPNAKKRQMKIHELITTSEALADLCERLAKSEFVAVDTEFMRENTYWPELCLVQIANTEEAAAIDPLADGIDLSARCSTC